MAFGSIAGGGGDGCVAITPAPQSGTVSNWAPVDAISGLAFADANIIRMDPGSGLTVTSMTTGADCRVVEIWNISTSREMYFASDDGETGTAANRFTLPWASTWALAPGASMSFRYDILTSRWYALNVDYASITDDGSTITVTGYLSIVGTNISHNVTQVLTVTATTDNIAGINARVSGTVDCTIAGTDGGAHAAAGINVVANATKSTGATPLRNYGVLSEANGQSSAEHTVAFYANAHGGTVDNYAWYAVAGDMYQAGDASFLAKFAHKGTTFGAFNATPITKPAVSGAGTAAWTSLMTALVNLGFVTNTSTPIGATGAQGSTGSAGATGAQGATGSAGLTTEHLSASGTISPTKDVTFIDVNATTPTFTLGDGTSDGFRKTVVSKFTDGYGVITVTNFLNGTTMTAGSFQNGGFTAVWDANLGKWRLDSSPLNYTY